MKKILYFIALSLLLCGSCNYEQDEKERYFKINEFEYIDMMSGDTVEFAYILEEPSTSDSTNIK